MIKQIICAGFGGQGVLTAGKILLYTAYSNNLKSTWFPAYGNEMRGGAANCNVIISDHRIASPYADHPDIVMALNGPSVDVFMPSMKQGAYLFVNSTLVKNKKYRDDIHVIEAPVTEISQNLHSERNANICMLGKISKETGLFSIDQLETGLCEYFEHQEKGKFNAKNIEVLRAGFNY
ncbi:MAG: 2-oxoacid:acceptor oxidoreductase family protein [Lachnospiraceae bacterium]|jgi:Pyruvate/2-oxoacid:ferredoxin oxidoreductase gamma subunit|nr:2-oxoacid:acceptor oxidoreductase family protein [Lachnospiraceae bacterium]MCI1656870.1 2-oxoacid:acceptor oxidoreductase family protein [Lachnospiraceae bacterium]MCI2195124.1 2-oxoacid:acceptor oxidoreductase family protein [Lachnospiraceae bacterium]